MHPHPVSVLVVDDHQVFADALQARLSMEDGFRPVMSAHSVAEAVARVQRAPIDVAVVDYGLGDGNGADLCRVIKEHHPASQVVIVSASRAVDAVVDALLAGASAWLAKSTDTAHLIEVIRGVHVGQMWLDPALLGAALPALIDRIMSPPPDPLAVLTAREREVLDCMTDGLGRADIAKRLGVSSHTVRTHTTNIVSKLGARSALEAVTFALRTRTDRT
jgi:DNA-binding NarL/FixJ family response regulator